MYSNHIESGIIYYGSIQQHNEDSYAAIHGKGSADTSTEPLAIVMDKSNYMFRENDIMKPVEENIILHTPLTNATSRRINLWSARHRRAEQRPSSTHASVSSDDQGPSRVHVSPRGSVDVLRLHKDGYPGAYSSSGAQERTVTALNTNGERRDSYSS